MTAAVAADRTVEEENNMKLKPICEQTIVMTGGTSGIGLATAREAARRGAKLVLMARSEDALLQLQEEMEQAGAQVVVVSGDVGNLEDVRRTAEMAVDRFGGFDTWINIAGVSIFGELMTVPLEDHRKLFETNYWGVVHGSQVAVEHLRKEGGALITVGSAVSDRAIPLQGSYSASKAAVKGYTDALRMELEHEGLPISVSLIQPASINTAFPFHAKNYMEKEARLPPPVYAPQLVVEAILECAEKPKRHVLVGDGAAAISWMGTLVPGFTDLFMKTNLFDQQKRSEPSTDRRDNLSDATEDLREEGYHDGPVFHQTLSGSTRHMPLAWAGLALVGVSAAVLLRGKGQLAKGGRSREQKQSPSL